MLKIDGVTHWSIPVNDLAESERFYRDVLGLEYRGRLGNSGMACVSVGGHDILLCERRDKVRRTPEQDNRLHHSFTLSPHEWEKGARFLHAHGVPVQELIYRESGFFPGREIYFLDPSGNMLEIRDPTWKPGMPQPAFAVDDGVEASRMLVQMEDGHAQFTENDFPPRPGPRGYLKLSEKLQGPCPDEGAGLIAGQDRCVTRVSA